MGMPHRWRMLDAGIVSALIVTIGGGGSAGYIHWRRRKDDRAEKVRRRADAHKELWYVLQQMKAQAERPDTNSQEPYVVEYDDIMWLRNHFRSNAALLSEKLHKEYTMYLKKYVREAFEEAQCPRRMDFTEMQGIARSEWDRYEREYKGMGGLDRID